MSGKSFTAIGLMSGTSLDGAIDVALIETDGGAYVKPLDFFEYEVPDYQRDMIARCFGKRERDDEAQAAEEYVTQIHIDAVKASGFEAELIGFHGQTILHNPNSKRGEVAQTVQLGDGKRMAVETGMDVVCDFRSADIAAGGEGAPLAPLYHAAIMADIAKPIAVLNLGGVANVTYICHSGESRNLVPQKNKIPAVLANKPAVCFAAGMTQEVMAFDCGPANALMDDYMKRHFEMGYDENGAVAESGKADRAVIDRFLADPYFQKQPPKSLDRDDFHRFMAELPDDPKDAMATLAVMSAVGVMASVKHFPRVPHAWYVCGGGRKNAFMMDLLTDMLAPSRVVGIEEAGYDGDAIEAQAFAYLAVRSTLGLPLSLPSTTGVDHPLTGGVLFKADSV